MNNATDHRYPGHRLFGDVAARYDIHTPPHHYQHDHEFVLQEIEQVRGEMDKLAGAPPKILDVGCGTGVFLDLALRADLDGVGLDVSPGMIEVAEGRLGPGVVRVQPMQKLDEVAAYDVIVSLCWSFNYCRSLEEARDVMARLFRATRPGGGLILQVAHAGNATGSLLCDREPGPGGEEDDVTFFYRFSPFPGDEPRLQADYVYACQSLNELCFETHLLGAADVLWVKEIATDVGYRRVECYDSWRREPFDTSVSPFLCARRPAP